MSMLEKVPKFDRCRFRTHPKYLMRDVEGNLVEEEDENQVKYVQPSMIFKNIYAMIDDPDMKPPFF